MRPRDMGVLFDECAERGVATRVHLDRPFDVPGAGALEYGVPVLAALVREMSGWLAAARAPDRTAASLDGNSVSQSPA